MNLAEIRKKAQRATEPATLPETTVTSQETMVADLAPPVDEVFEHEPPCCKTEELPADHDLPEASAVEEPATPSTGFDPLALILAGREGLDDSDETIETGKEEVAAGERVREFLCFRVSDELYAIDIMEIKEIIKPREITEVPRVPAFLTGILSLRGTIIPVFNMRVRLGLPPSESATKERILVVRKGEEFCGLIVDEVTQVVRIPVDTIEEPPGVLDGVDRDFVEGIGRRSGMMLILLNLGTILDINLH